MSFYSDDVRDLLRTRIPQIAEAHARALGLPEDRMPVVKFLDNGNRATYNDPALTAQAVKGFEWAVGAANVVPGEQLLGTDETAELAHAYPTPVPMMFFYYGSSNPAALAAARARPAAAEPARPGVRTRCRRHARGRHQGASRGGGRDLAAVTGTWPARTRADIPQARRHAIEIRGRTNIAHRSRRRSLPLRGPRSGPYPALYIPFTVFPAGRSVFHRRQRLPFHPRRNRSAVPA